MRQGDGSELPGISGPRSTDIGIIHVAPNDDRQSVLAAILTQDKLGRKQVAVVLPQENRAFQRPVDFDGLKNMRRGLKTQIIFIAPPGPGPAEFARQRRFPVYSSLESYARSLQEAGQFGEGAKKGRFFLPWQKPSSAPPASSASSVNPGPVSPPPMTPVATSGQAPAGDEEVPGERERNPGAGIVAGGAAVAMGMEALSHQAGNPPSFDDWDEFSQTTPAESGPGDSLVDDTPTQENTLGPSTRRTTTQNGPEPNIIQLPQQRTRNTDKLSIPAIMPVAAAQPRVPPASASATTRQRNSGKVPAVAAVGAGAAGAGVGVATRTVRPGGVPPTRGNVPGGGGGGGRPRRPIGRILLFLAALLALTLVICGLIAYASPSTLGPLRSLIPAVAPPPATVTITPASSHLKNTYGIFGVTGTPSPDPTQRQVQARLLSSTTTPQSKTVNATGVGHTPGTQATGRLTFYNALTFSQTVANHTVFNLSNGIQIENDALAVIPAANPPTEGSVTVPAHAIQAGSAGNIKAFSLNGSCCLTGVTVQNTAPFTGGQDPQTFTFVQQSDIDSAANPLVSVLTPIAQRSLQAQVRSNEQFVNAPQCSRNVTANPAAGTKASSVTVTVKVTCAGEVFDRHAAQMIAATLLTQQAGKVPGPGYALVGNLVTSLGQVMVTDSKKGTLLVSVKAEGIWVFQFSEAQKQALAKLIAGKSKKDAQSLLLSQPGVAGAQIALSSGNTLPSDPTQITIVIQTIPGLPAAPIPTTGPGGPTVPTPTPTPGSSVGKG